MDEKLFLEKLSEVSEWEYKKHTGDSSVNPGRSAEDSETAPTYPVIIRLKDRPCAYAQPYNNCDIIIKASDRSPRVYVQRCRTCKRVIYNGQAHDLDGRRDLAAFVVSLIKQR